MTSSLQKLCIDHHILLATAESCTGGNIARQITVHPGSSAYFLGAVVAYSNEVKENVLGVSAENLSVFGAVSEAVVIEMAQGVRRVMKCDYSVATTGIAGPGGGTVNKPVGTVWIGVSYQGGVDTQKHQIEGNRGDIVLKATEIAIAMIYQRIFSTVTSQTSH